MWHDLCCIKDEDVDRKAEDEKMMSIMMNSSTILMLLREEAMLYG